MNQQDIWNTVQHNIGKTIEEEENYVFSSVAGSGKTHGTLKVANNNPGMDFTILQPNRDLREENIRKIENDNDDFDRITRFDTFNYPSFPNQSSLHPDSPNVSVDEKTQKKVDSWYRRKMAPNQIKRTLGGEVPNDDEYFNQMQTDVENRQVVFGDPYHAYLPKAVRDRNVVFDDCDFIGTFSDRYQIEPTNGASEFEHAESSKIKKGITQYLEWHASQLNGNVTSAEQLMSHATLDERSELVNFTETNPSRDIIKETGCDEVTANTSALVRLLATDSRYNTRHTWEEEAPNNAEPIKVVGYTRKQGENDEGLYARVWKIPTELKNARSVTILSATPLPALFEQIFEDLGIGAHLDTVISGEQEIQQFKDRKYNITQLCDYPRPYSSGNWAEIARCINIILRFEQEHNTKPVVITTKAVINMLKDPISHLEQENNGINWDDDFWDTDDGIEMRNRLYNFDLEEYEYLNYARAIGTNEFANHKNAVLLGSTHYGDEYVKDIAHYCGDTDSSVKRIPGSSQNQWSTQASQEIYEHMTESTVYQALMRIGRTVSGQKNIWVDTNQLPDFVPRNVPKDGVKDVMIKFNHTMQDVLNGIREGHKSVIDIFRNHNPDDKAKRTFYNAAKRLRQHGYLEIGGKLEAGKQLLAVSGDYTELELALGMTGGTISEERLQDPLLTSILETSRPFSAFEPEPRDISQSLATSASGLALERNFVSGNRTLSEYLGESQAG